MSDLLAMSFDMPVSPSISFNSPVRAEGAAGTADLPRGWGMGWYPGDESAAVVIKDPTSVGDNVMAQVLQGWERFRSATFLCHLRGAAQRVTQRDTHPFIRTFAGRHWLMAHNGTLQGDLDDSLPLGDDSSLEPIGRTDTERAFCWLLAQVKAAGARTLAGCGWSQVHAWLEHINALGTSNLLLTDGQSLVVHRDRSGFSSLYWTRITPPHLQTPLEGEGLQVNFGGLRDEHCTGLVFFTRPAALGGWVQMSASQTLVARRGALVWDSLSVWAASTPSVSQATPAPPGRPREARSAPLQQPQTGPVPAPAKPEPAPASEPQGAHAFSRGAPVVGDYWPPAVSDPGEARQMLRVVHETVYRYGTPVENSSHLFRLRPVHDARQTLHEYTLELSVDGLRREFEDVFGNSVLRLEVSSPYAELAIRTRSVVTVAKQPRLDLRSPHRRDQIPLVWMPWQRQMMLPYLLPPELAESELQELHQFAMSFVERNDFELLETLLDINQTLHRDFAYVSGATTLSTTPYQVYVNRRGVCQDFANLLICLARLLNVPARYRAGYIYTGAQYENRMQSDASHAWVELYLPWVGWHGFDPTNGCLVGLDHVRVACGRNFQDATPTSGTIYRGGGSEALTVNVQVEQVP